MVLLFYCSIVGSGSNIACSDNRDFDRLSFSCHKNTKAQNNTKWFCAFLCFGDLVAKPGNLETWNPGTWNYLTFEIQFLTFILTIPPTRL